MKDEKETAGPDITVQFITVDPDAPSGAEIRRWARSALNGKEGEVTIRITDEDEMQSLNYKWRNTDSPTNVLSFPLHDAGAPLLGDVIICAPVLRHEAERQAKSLDAHWAHMITHGILHLMGYDHTNGKKAEIMEAKETAILQGLGFPDPYLPGVAITPDKSG